MGLVPIKNLYVYDTNRLTFSHEMVELYLKNNLVDKYVVSQENIVKCTREFMGLPVSYVILCSLINAGNKNILDNISLVKKYTLNYLTENTKYMMDNRFEKAIVLLTLFNEFNNEMIVSSYGKEFDGIVSEFVDYLSIIEEYAEGQYRLNKLISNIITDYVRSYVLDNFGERYLEVGGCYEKPGNYEEAMRCYYSSKYLNSFTEFVIKMCERADCSFFTKECAKYMNIIDEEKIMFSPRLLGVKILILSYSMRVEECKKYLKKLYKMAIEEKRQEGFGNINKILAHTLAVLPHQTALQVFSKIDYTLNWIGEQDLPITNVSPTAAMPSVLNGAIDLSKYCRKYEKIYDRIHDNLVQIFGNEFLGVADICLGETFYEMNEFEKAVSSLTVGIAQENYRGDRKEALEWRKKYAPLRENTFFITDRLSYLTYAKICIMLGKYYEALGLLEILEYYGINYNRNYILTKVNLYKAIIFYRIGKYDEMKSQLEAAVEKAYISGLIRIIADEGAALMPAFSYA